MTIDRNQLRGMDFSDIATGQSLHAMTPGEILKSEFLDPLGISQYRLAKSIGVPAQRIGAIIMHGRTITADTDLRLCHFFKLSEGFFLRLQVLHDVQAARQHLGSTLATMPSYDDV